MIPVTPAISFAHGVPSSVVANISGAVAGELPEWQLYGDFVHPFRGHRYFSATTNSTTDPIFL